MTIERRLLPQRRHCENVTVEFWNQHWTLSLGFYEDHRTIGEVFISASRTPGSSLDAVARDAAILLSLCLQHGVPIALVKGAITREANGAPSSIAGRVVDYVAERR